MMILPSMISFLSILLKDKDFRQSGAIISSFWIMIGVWMGWEHLSSDWTSSMKSDLSTSEKIKIDLNKKIKNENNCIEFKNNSAYRGLFQMINRQAIESLLRQATDGWPIISLSIRQNGPSPLSHTPTTQGWEMKIKAPHDTPIYELIHLLPTVLHPLCGLINLKIEKRVIHPTKNSETPENFIMAGIAQIECPVIVHHAPNKNDDQEGQ